eukprot:Skav229697  [mRNA]  locus=scaffold3722:241279:252077:- [translate_table: standard]
MFWWHELWSSETFEEVLPFEAQRKQAAPAWLLQCLPFYLSVEDFLNLRLLCRETSDRKVWNRQIIAAVKPMRVEGYVEYFQIDFVEMIGGASRVPWVKEGSSRNCGAGEGAKAVLVRSQELSTTMNADESVARGCALQAAMLSPLYKVRDFAVVDVPPPPVTIGWMGSAADAEAEKADEDGEHMGGAEALQLDAWGEYKTMTVFPRNSQMGTVKMLTFYRKGPFDLKLEYEDTSAWDQGCGRLVEGVGKHLGNFKAWVHQPRVDLAPAADTKKIKVKVPAEEKSEEPKPDSPKDAKPEARCGRGEASPEGEAEKKEGSPKKEPEKKAGPKGGQEKSSSRAMTSAVMEVSTAHSSALETLVIRCGLHGAPELSADAMASDGGTPWYTIYGY